ncbi:hypothetical protein BH18ACT1_BH18ACT1_02790 [soil metagenome]
MIVTDVEGCILVWNPAAEVLYGWSAAEVLERNVLEVTPATSSTEDASAVMARLQAGESWSGEMGLRRRNGETFLARVTNTPVLDEAGQLVAIIGVSEDVTERRWAEAELRRSEQRLRVALRAGQLGIWEWDRSTGVVEWDSTTEAMFGLVPGAFGGTIEEYLDRVHPDDRGAILEAIEGAVADGRDLDIEHRVLARDGSDVWLACRGAVVRVDGDPTGMIGVTADVSERRDAEVERQRLLEAEAAARAEAEASRDRIRFLADATVALNEDLDLEERLQRLVRLIVPRFADGCAVYLLDDDGISEVRTLLHRDVESAQLERMIEQFPVHLDAPGGAGAAIREARTAWASRITDEVLASIARDEEHLDWLRGLGLRSGVVVPLRGRTRSLGSVIFVHTSERTMTEPDVALAEALCDRAGIAVENAQLVAHRNDAQAQLRFQAALLEAQNEAGADADLLVDPEGRILSYNRQFIEVWRFDRALRLVGERRSAPRCSGHQGRRPRRVPPGCAGHVRQPRSADARRGAPR